MAYFIMVSVTSKPLFLNHALISTLIYPDVFSFYDTSLFLLHVHFGQIIHNLPNRVILLNKYIVTVC